MLNSVSLKNFKAFGKKAEIPFAPLTILCGPNNSGKSSILHSMLLLKQTDESDSAFPLCPVGRYGSFGSYRDLAHDKSLPSLGIGLSVLFPREVPLKFARRALGLAHLRKKEAFVDLSVNLYLQFVEDANNECGFRLRQGDLSLSVHGAKKHPSLRWNARRLIRTTDAGLPLERLSLPLHVVNFWPAHLERRGHEYGITGLPGIFNGALFRLKRYFQSISYLGPLREDPHRYYLLDKEFFADLGPRGENTWNALAHSPVRKVMFFDAIRKRQNTMSLREAVNWWLRYCDIADQITTKKRSGDPIYQVVLKGDFKGTRSIVDLGFGVSQILPVLVMGLLGGQNELLLFEQPEIHVHPAIQVRLADFFIAIAKSGRQVVVETHSEHIINRIRTRILEERLGPHEVSILFLEKDDQHESRFEKIQFAQDGQIANWPDGFFDTHVTEIKAQSKALRKRIRA